MKLKFRHIAALAAVLAAAGLCMLWYQNQRAQTVLGLSAGEKTDDFDALCSLLDRSYPFWEEAGVDRDALYRTGRDEAAASGTDIEYFKCIDRFLGEFGGAGHLSVLDGSGYALYEDTLLAGQSLLSAAEQQQTAPLRQVLESPLSSRTYSLLDRSHAGFRTVIGLKEEYQEAQDSTAQPAGTAGSGLTTEILADGQAAYLKIESFSLTSYEPARAELEEFFGEIREIPNLILDLRGNGGGSDRFWEDLLVEPIAAREYESERWYLLSLNEDTRSYVEALGLEPEELSALPQALFRPEYGRFTHCVQDTTRFEPAAEPYTGRIWLLVDDSVYSAAENFAFFCKNSGFAALVGTPTGGDGGIADPLLFSLPESGLIVRFSVFYGLNPDGSGNEACGTQPDYTVPEGADALDYCLELIGSGQAFAPLGPA